MDGIENIEEVTIRRLDDGSFLMSVTTVDDISGERDMLQFSRGSYPEVMELLATIEEPDNE